MSNYLRNLKISFVGGDVTLIPHRLISSVEFKGGVASISFSDRSVSFNCEHSTFVEICKKHEDWSTECGELFKNGNFFPHALDSLNKAIDFQMGEGLDRVIGRLDEISVSLANRADTLCGIADKYTKLLGD